MTSKPAKTRSGTPKRTAGEGVSVIAAKVGKQIASRLRRRNLNTALMLVFTAASVYIAYTANQISEFQTETMVMQSTITQSQNAPVFSFDTTPSLNAILMDGRTNMDATRSIVVSNLGAPVVNLLCDPITFLTVDFLENGEVRKSAVMPLEGFYLTPEFFGRTVRGTGELVTIRGIENNQGDIYRLMDDVEAAGQADGLDIDARFTTLVRVEFTNALSAQENRLYLVGILGVARIDADYAGTVLLGYQDKVRHKQVLDLEDATARQVVDYAQAIVARTGGDDPLPAYDALMPPPYKDPDADLTDWSSTFYQEPYWQSYDANGTLRAGSGEW